MKSSRLFILTFLLTSLFSTTTVQASTIYTWEDEKGVVHFSDQPRPGADTINLNIPEPSNSKAKSADKSQTTNPQPEQTKEPALPAATISLISPLHEQTVRNNEGIIDVSVVSNRKLTKGHNARLLLDGKPYGRPQTKFNWQLHNIDRGSHTLQAQLLKHGKVIASSDMITVYLHRASILNRQPPAITPK
ncbi:DUF4124 domain-containing protein [Photobacterium sp. J15]|uniref:DUF4124 domain-containing protein n=1 Tax=Photobacterium sp. J15 TaxID=265901 RepID=UPI0007E4BC34|nr:DUF4124 domain-containing protein [Photobacterium sp. J15]